MTDDSKFPLGAVATGGLSTAPGAFVFLGHPLSDWMTLVTLLGGALGLVCSSLYIIDWMWKRWWKPFAIRRGWIAGEFRGYMASTDLGGLGPPER